MYIVCRLMFWNKQQHRVYIDDGIGWLVVHISASNTTEEKTGKDSSWSTKELWKEEPQNCIKNNEGKQRKNIFHIFKHIFHIYFAFIIYQKIWLYCVVNPMFYCDVNKRSVTPTMLCCLCPTSTLFFLKKGFNSYICIAKHLIKY